MKFAVVGTGLVGLATARHIQKTFPEVELTLIDENPLKGGASHIAAGMVHTLMGHEGKKHPKGATALTSALALIREVEDFSKETLFHKGLLRTPRDSRFLEPLKASDPKHWLEAEEVFLKSEGSVTAEGLWIDEGGQLFVEKYLKGLIDLILSKGGRLKTEKIESLEQLKEYDISVLALGYGFKSLALQALPELSFKLGQLAELKLRAPPFPIIGRAYVAQSPKKGCAIVGGTYENLTEGPSAEAIEKLLGYAKLAYPSIEEGELIACLSAVRAYGPNKKPFCTQISSGIWALGGVGSKGILLHVHLAQALANEIQQQIKKR